MDVAGTDGSTDNKKVMENGVSEFLVLYNMGSNRKKSERM